MDIDMIWIRESLAKYVLTRFHLGKTRATDERLWVEGKLLQQFAKVQGKGRPKVKACIHVLKTVEAKLRG